MIDGGTINTKKISAIQIKNKKEKKSQISYTDEMLHLSLILNSKSNS